MEKLLGPETGYIDLLDHFTKEHLEGEVRISKNPLRPSNAGKCTRELFHDLMEFNGKAKYKVETLSPEVHRLLSLGHSIEYHIVRHLEDKLGELFEVRYKQQVLSFGSISPEYLLEGSIDLCLYSDKFKCVIDIKSKKDRLSTFAKTKWDEDNEKFSEMQSVRPLSPSAFYIHSLSDFLEEEEDPFLKANFLQLNLYANNAFLQERGINHAALIYYNKNDSRLREMRFRPCPKTSAMTLAKFRTVDKAVKEEQILLAPKDYLLGSLKCAFCSYGNICWGENSLKAWWATFPKKEWPTKLSDLQEDRASRYDKAFQKYESLNTKLDEREKLEEAICKEMFEHGIQKLELLNGHIYELKYLKSPRPHYELRRAKK